MVRKSVIPLVGILLLGAGTYGYHQYALQQRAEIAKAKAEGLRIREAFRQAGLQSAALQRAQVALPQDPLAPEDAMSDEAELAQAKLWQKLSKSQRDAMRSDAASVTSSEATPAQ